MQRLFQSYHPHTKGQLKSDDFIITYRVHSAQVTPHPPVPHPPSPTRLRVPCVCRTAVGVCLLTLYVIWLDQASQGLAAWLAAGSPLAEFLSNKFLSGQGMLQNWGMVDEGDEMAWAYA